MAGTELPWLLANLGFFDRNLGIRRSPVAALRVELPLRSISCWFVWFGGLIVLYPNR